MLDPLSWLNEELAAWEAKGLRRKLIAREGPQFGCRFVHAGRKYLNFGSNDYLGLANSPEIVAAVREQLADTGWGAGASPLVTGRGEWHARLEHTIAEFEGSEAALLFPTGYAANVGAIAALAGKEDAIFSDARNHASIIDGCRLSGAPVYVYQHVNVADLERMLQTAGPSARRKLIVTDGLFSMDGDLAPMNELIRVAEAHNGMLLVDEAHATGVFGEHARGVSDGCDYPGLIRVGTLSKALGSHGGFVAGSRTLIEWLANRARPYVFSTAAPEALAVAGCKALEIVHREPERRTRLLEQAATLRSALTSRGYRIGNSQSQIIPIIVGDPERTMRASLALREQGLWVPGIRPPSVPEGESLLRVSLTSEHTPEMVERLVEGLEST